MKIFLKVFFVAIIFSFFSFQTTDVKSSISNSLKRGDSKSLSNYFSSSISLAIHGDENVVSKFQAALMVSDFFNKNKIVDVKNLSNSPANKYFLYELKTQKRSFRVLIKLVEIKRNMFISELRIE